MESTEVPLDHVLARIDDLGQVDRALARERAIRAAMARTGEGRMTIAEMIDAMDSMGQEGVLSLTDGAPTTLCDALARLVESLPEDGLVHGDDLTALLDYPWPAEEERLASHGLNESLQLHVDREDGEVLISIGANRWTIFRARYDGHQMQDRDIEEAARAVHRAVLGRVIGDRDHSVQINAAEASSLIAWAVNSSGGSWSPGNASRLSVDAVAGGGWLVRTRPYAWQYQVNEERRRAEREEQLPTWSGADSPKHVPAEDATVIPADQVKRAVEG